MKTAVAAFLLTVAPSLVAGLAVDRESAARTEYVGQQAPPLPRCGGAISTSGPTITVGPEQAAGLPDVVAAAAPGTTVLLKDGAYRLSSGVKIRRPGITLRSASGDARAVVIDGQYRTPELVVITASDVTIADVTLTRAVDHLVHIMPAGPATVRSPRLRGLRLIDAGEQFVKVNPDFGRTAPVDAGVLECSLLQLTDEGRPRVETLGGTSCYTGGIDAHLAAGWTVRRNRFEGLFCRTGFLAEHAIHFWNGSRDTVVEQNTIVNCARGIGLGLGPSTTERGGLVRNNMIYADIPEYDTGIGLEQAVDVRVLHNTVFATSKATRAYSSIDARFAGTKAEIVNNLVNNITVRQGATVTATHNVQRVTTTAFVDPAKADLHLRADFAAAVNAGRVLPDAGLDIDGEPRGATPDIGADERGAEPAHRRQGFGGPPKLCAKAEGPALQGMKTASVLRHREAGDRDVRVVSEPQSVDAVG